jgi:hypothetical protein
MSWVKSCQIEHGLHIMHLKSIFYPNLLDSWNGIVLARIPLKLVQPIIHLPVSISSASLDSPSVKGAA